MNNSINNLLKEGIECLQVPGIENPSGDARLLLAHALGVSKMDLILLEPQMVGHDVSSNFFSLINLRKQLKPVSQLIGFRSFWGRNFYINENVLDPRPETEIIIERSLERKFEQVLDLGTGSGVLIITLLLERDSVSGTAVDISRSALKVAKKNIKKFGLKDRISIIKSNWGREIDKKFDLIVANPPYIDIKKTNQFNSQISVWEPKIALFSDQNGLAAYWSIAKKLGSLLRSDGTAIFEIGYDQGSQVSDIFKDEGFKTSVFKDLANKDRVIEVTFE